MNVLTSTKGQKDLPRYFPAVFDVASQLNHGRLEFHLPDGRIFSAEGRKPGLTAVINVHNPDCFARLIREGDMGFSDAYLEGWWSSPDLQVFMDTILDRNEEVFDGFPGMGFLRVFERFRHWMHSNSKEQAKKNIAYHYDLGNEFYSKWLDETMTYSSALFSSDQQDLSKAQIAKYKSMVDQMGVKPGDHVLEIGCGWGGFAEYAAGQRGLRVTGLTISKEQHDYAVERIKRAGLSDMVEIVMRDYRDEVGVYDGIASIEMFEAVGENYWPTYFNTVRERLKPGAKATLQIITIAEKRFAAYRKGVDFIQKHIFPGGMLPSVEALTDQITRAGLLRLNSIEFGDSYSLTLRRWHEIFNDKWDEVRELGFDDRFKRMWNYYLTSCAAAFQSGNCDVTQVTLERPS
ncbi:MAG: cyclopropane-fatty-acyl-phospholipid synthase family protein [Rhodobacterales bacterium]|mgnify:FL=1|jgi:cyclopropane-fatty-acyl-phospholipid synthase|nr:class I SAM-dependent methyltransferase [Rhodobacter sp.]HBN30965.1 SAM-dependent methyltransferase [Paracoccaceae bacterium]